MRLRMELIDAGYWSTNGDFRDMPRWFQTWYLKLHKRVFNLSKHMYDIKRIDSERLMR